MWPWFFSCKCWPHLCIFGCPENSILFIEYNCQTFQFLAFVTASLCSLCFMPFVVDHLLLKSQTSEFCQHRQAGWDLRFKQLLEQFVSPQVYTIFCQNCYNTGRRELVLYLYWDIVCVMKRVGQVTEYIMKHWFIGVSGSKAFLVYLSHPLLFLKLWVKCNVFVGFFVASTFLS